ncbi:hypothetical protein EON64_19035 [archaeon]|nr:MAG: hypothetical protein EON64_19035 [archaeon]
MSTVNHALSIKRGTKGYSGLTAAIGYNVASVADAELQLFVDGNRCPGQKWELRSTWMREGLCRVSCLSSEDAVFSFQSPCNSEQLATRSGLLISCSGEKAVFKTICTSLLT